jgi:AmiR/NasT family two-component response regulator
LLFAAHAAIAMAGAQREDQLQRAVHSRDLIGQAKGMLMQRFDIGSQQAFELLSRLSQEDNIKLRAVAERLFNTGTITEDRPPHQH